LNQVGCAQYRDDGPDEKPRMPGFFEFHIKSTARTPEKEGS
jgi:hypothetical protein